MALSFRSCVLWVLAVWKKCTNSQKKKFILGLAAISIVCVITVGSTAEVLGPDLSGFFFFFFSRPQKKMLIYVCLEGHGCGGWADRQRGMVGMFLLALVTNRRYGILLKTPCDVSNFYIPNEYNWTVDQTELDGRKPRLIYPGRGLSKMDFNQRYPEDVIFARVNNDFFWEVTSNPRFKPFLPDWARKRYSYFFHHGWNILMKPTPKVQQRVDQFLATVNYHNRSKPLVGVHLRMGKNPSNPLERRSFYNVSRLAPLWHSVERYVKNGSQLFVASDSEEVRNMSRLRFGSVHHDTAGVILHIGKQRHDARACQGFEDAVVDQLVLSYCEVLFMSRGGFSTKAILMGMRVKKTHFFKHGKVFR